MYKVTRRPICFDPYKIVIPLSQHIFRFRDVRQMFYFFTEYNYCYILMPDKCYKIILSN